MKLGEDYIGVAVGILIFNEKGQLLLNKRGAKTRNEQGKWECCGGAVDFNETRRDAAIREAKEEFGIDIENVEESKTFD